MLAENNEDYDYVLIFEGDVIIDSPYSELYSKLIDFNQTAIETDMDIIGFGNPTNNRKTCQGKKDIPLLNDLSARRRIRLVVVTLQH